MRIILMGTGPFAVPAFEAIRNSSDEIAAVITKPVPTDKKTPLHPVAKWAMDVGLQIQTPSDLREPAAVDLLQSFQADLSVVCDYGQILKLDALHAARLGAINLHGSLLPKHRGAAPVQWSILAGDTVTGVSVIRMTTGLDSGPVLTSTQTNIEPGEDASQLEPRLSQLGVAITLQAIDMLRQCASLEDAKQLGIKQDSSLSTKAPRFAKSDGHLDFRWNAELLDRVVRALQPWPGAFAEVQLASGNPLRIQIKRAVPIVEPQYAALSTVPGQLSTLGNLLAASRLETADATSCGLNAQDLVVTTGNGLLQILQIQPAGKRSLAANEFIAGYCRNTILNFIAPATTTLIV